MKMPLSPPIVNRDTKPRANSIGVFRTTLPVHMVTSQQKTWVPEAITTIRLAAVKKLSPICGRPVANI